MKISKVYGKSCADIGCIIYFQRDMISLSMCVGFHDYFLVVMAKGEDDFYRKLVALE